MGQLTAIGSMLLLFTCSLTILMIVKEGRGGIEGVPTSMANAAFSRDAGGTGSSSSVAPTWHAQFLRESPHDTSLENIVRRQQEGEVQLSKLVDRTLTTSQQQQQQQQQQTQHSLSSTNNNAPQFDSPHMLVDNKRSSSMSSSTAARPPAPVGMSSSSGSDTTPISLGARATTLPPAITSFAPGEAPLGKVWSPVLNLTRGDWLVYLRIQKTGSQTFWETLQGNFRSGALWGPRSKGTCQKGLFCGHRCLDVVKQQIREIEASQAASGGVKEGAGRSNRRSGRGDGRGGRRLDLNQCRLMFRGHISYRDYEEGFRATITKQERAQTRGLPYIPPILPRVLFLSFFREPVARALSEYKHITEGLVAQFGPHTFGAAWDYNFSFTGRRDDIKKKRKEGTFEAWLQCKACQIGASNRMTRFLGGSATTGTMDESQSDVEMLELAKQRLDQCTFIGIMEKYPQSMFILVKSFPKQLGHIDTYRESPHPKNALRQTVTEQQMRHLASLNQLDSALYDHAQVLFNARMKSMRSQLPPNEANMAFRGGGRGPFHLS